MSTISTAANATIIFDMSAAAAVHALTNLSRVDPSIRRGVLLGDNITSLDQGHVLLGNLQVLPLLDPALIFVPQQWGVSMKTRNTYHRVAEVCLLPIEQITLITSISEHAAAALQAGMRVISLPVQVRGIAPASGAEPNAAELAAGEIEEDVGSAMILRGRIVTMNDGLEVIDDGRLLVSQGLIRHILRPGAAVPADFEDIQEVITAGTIYPGLIDLHNHFAYNVLPLWVVPKKYSNRGQWPGHIQYKEFVSMPMKQALTRSLVSAEAILRFVEAKSLMGGATTGQGIQTPMRGGKSLAFGGMRNVEQTKDSRLVNARTKVPDLAGASAIESFRSALQGPGAFFYHLSEGTDNVAHKHFVNLEEEDLLADTLIGVHSLALKPADFQKMADLGASIVWSPFSNKLLYGETLDLNVLKDTQVRFAIGCDWSPSGSKNVLQELKVAQFVNQQQGSPFTNQQLVAAVTSQAAEMVRWGEHLGRIQVGFMADLLVLEGNDIDPYEQLISALERDVVLVAIHGIARYGRDTLMEQLLTAEEFEQAETFEVDGAAQAFYFKTPLSPINHLTLAGAIDRLNEAMGDLPAWKEKAEQEAGQLAAFGIEEEVWHLEMDNELEEDDPFSPYSEDDFAVADLAATPTMPTSIPLDSLYVTGDDYWQRIDQQPNVEEELKVHLRKAYGLPEDT